MEKIILKDSNNITEEQAKKFIENNEKLKQEEFSKKLKLLCDEYEVSLIPQMVLTVQTRKK